MAQVPQSAPGPGGMPDYFGIYPNYANSPRPTIDLGSGAISGGIRKFVDALPGLGPANANNLGQFIPIATPLTNPDGTPVYPGSDYYEIGAVAYTQQLHSDLPDTTMLRGYKDLAPAADGKPHFLGPMIIAKAGTPVRIKFTNLLPTGSAGDFFLPADTTVMGAGMGPDGSSYTQNRSGIHLHGGNTPWISDGTPHQWTTPNGEPTTLKKGVSTQNVPDMPDPGDGAMTFYYPNQQSARLMFYHDHSYGITRLGVYAGEAAPYLLTDATEEDLISNKKVLPDLGGVYHYGVPLVIQDKTFVPDSDAIAAQDPTWNWGGYGNLWFPHVYVPNQNPSDDAGVNAMGRWDYGPWFWPPMAAMQNGPVPCPSDSDPARMCPGTPNPSIVPEAFMDTPLVNGTPYPFLQVSRRAYRFRILNASNDRSLNLQLYYADASGTEVKMVPALPNTGLPPSWPTDGRDGGVPDPAASGPAMIQIGTEGGLLPAPVVLPNTPIGYNYNRRDIVVLNVANKTLFLGPAERADVIIDFSGVPDGSRLILYNDAPAPVPAFDTRYDYYTGDPDQIDTGGAPTTIAGYGPNTRTVMQFRVSGGTAAAPFSLAALQAAFSSSSTQSGAFAASQPAPIVPEAAYGPAFNATYTNTFSRIESTALTFTPIGASAPVTVQLQPKAIQELFDPYGRMNSTLGVEIPFTNLQTQTTIPYGYIDPATEIIKDGETQIWKITHNGVDTHAIHFHLFNVQVINRVGWDGAIRPPDPNELGWKETVRMNPLEDAIVALQPMKQVLPWPIPDSIRLLDVTMPAGSTMGFSNVDPHNNPIKVVNELTNFGWEYVWHCHLLGHEENDMMRPVILQVSPEVPGNLVATGDDPDDTSTVQLNWTDSSLSEDGFTLQRATDVNFSENVILFAILPSEGEGAAVSFSDTTIGSDPTYYYRVQSFSSNGTSAWSNIVQVGALPLAYSSPTSLSFPNQTVNTASLAQTVTLSNTGVAGMAINRITITGANPKDFLQSTTCGASLGAGAACTISIVFKPTASGPRAASLNLSESDQVHPLQTVSLSGAGIAGVGQISSPLSFGEQLVNTSSSPQTVTLTNGGAAFMTIGSIAITGTNPAAFAQTSNCGAALAPAASCAISVRFKPVTAGASSASLAIATSDPMNPALSVSLSGTGTTDFSLALAATSVSLKSGSGAAVNLTVMSGSTFVGAIGLTCTGLPAHSTCSFSPSSLNAAGDDAPLLSTLTFATGLTTASVERRPATTFLLAYWTGMPALGLLGLLILPMRNKARCRKTFWVVTALLGLLAIGMLVGCGGSSTTSVPPPTPPATPLGSYSVTVTASAGNISHSTSMTLFVQ
jgi:FtsP/CotA-like multicopper oxidase with cupredoxin domain